MDKQPKITILHPDCGCAAIIIALGIFLSMDRIIDLLRDIFAK
jgi:hypothetical protein